MLEAGDDLRTHALDGVVVQTRLAHGEAQQFERRVDVARERLQLTVEVVMLGVERDLDGEIVHRAVEGFGVVGAGAFVQQSAEHARRAGLSRGVLRRAGLECEIEGDEGNGVILDKPDFEAARRLHLLDGCGARRRNFLNYGAHVKIPMSQTRTEKGRRGPPRAC